MKRELLIVLILMVAGKAFTAEVEIGGLWYEVLSKTKEAKVIQYKNNKKYSGNIVIPETVEYEGTNYNVRSIGEVAFGGCSSLTSVIIPNSVTSIGNSAFSVCEGLKTITIPNSVKNIGKNVFFYCGGLTSVTIGNGVTSIGEGAFWGLNNLTSVHLTDIASWCKIDFYDNSSNPLNHAHHLFLNGEEVKELVIPNSVTSIGDCAFYGCSELTSVTIPNSVNSIGGSAFGECGSLTSVDIPNSVNSIGRGAFYGCSSLTSVNIPNSVNSIGGNAFYGCSSLTSVTIPYNVTSIEERTFYDCSNLTSVTIPNSVNNIGEYAFSGCASLTLITIGKEVKTIGQNSFAECPELADVYCMVEELSSINNWGNNSLSTNSTAFNNSLIEYATLHVPASAINDYMTIEPWSGFGKFMTLSGEEMETKKCATPTISLENGEIIFGCETEGVAYISEVVSSDIQKFYDDKLKLSYKYTVTVYAIKEGFENSDTATAEFTATGKFGDLNGDGKVNVADHVKLSETIMNQ